VHSVLQQSYSYSTNSFTFLLEPSFLVPEGILKLPYLLHLILDGRLNLFEQLLDISAVYIGKVHNSHMRNFLEDKEPLSLLGQGSGSLAYLSLVNTAAFLPNGPRSG
jgi:hypothetical protein